MEIDLPRDRINAYLRDVPKVELHVHVEGTLEPELAFALARRNGVALPWSGVEALRAAYAFDDLQQFLDLYYAGAAVLRTEQDFFELAWAYLQRAAAENVVHAEIFFDPQAHTARGVPLATVLSGLWRACQEARRLGIGARLILCFLRHLGEGPALETLEEALPHRDRFIGVGLDSSERGFPPELFARVFARSRALGLHRVAHAGEEGPAAYVRTALDALQVERIDHGVRCLEDPALVDRLVRERIPLTVCPLSNVRLRVFDRLADHPLGRMLDAGLIATVNSDDPAYFGGYLVQNLTESFASLGLGGRTACRVVRHGFEAAFLEPRERARLLDRLDDFTTRFR